MEFPRKYKLKEYVIILVLVAAFVGEDWKRIYDYALSHDFRFLSYGDSSLLMPKGL
jgi:S-adenosylmethionine:tRNA-ribosyltransferase-isomerase (queuine synthetase)